MLTNNWKSEFYRLLLWLSAGLLLGWLLNLTPWGVALAACGFAARSIYKLHKLQQWLAHRSSIEPPEASGMWGEVMDGLYRMQQKYRRERVRLRALISYLRESFTSLPYGAVIIDSENNIEWSNSAAQTLLGLRYPEDSGQQIVNLVRAPAFIKYFESEEYSQPLELSSPAQYTVQLQIHITFFGKRSRLLFARDVTQTYRLEQMRKDFVANVSHELRTPLTVINGYLETFADSAAMGPGGDGNSRWRRALDQMLVQSRRMQTLINDLLLLSRLETLPQSDHQQAWPVRPILEIIREEALASVGEAREISIDCDDDIAVIGQRDELHSAFANIVFNAVRYTETGGKIAIRWYADHGEACMEVRDNGVGIDAEHIPRLTERFYRVEKSRSMDTGGTGLGLAIVKHVLIRHHAQLVITSQAGVGSAFTCVFPATQIVREPMVAQH
ncbi:MAG TPA: phosphate regulon sensor histidine kinase PhoR [Spongiibacteraceae bacterium]|nr:phosphate regulon sensor histidine kinase PhoR [Spongiibacteraceae bacterium]